MKQVFYCAACLLLAVASLPARQGRAAAGEVVGAAGVERRSAMELLAEGKEEPEGKGERLRVADLRKLLGRERGVTVEEMGETLIVDGRISSAATKERLRRIAARYENILDLTEFIMDEDAMVIRAQFMQKKIEERLNLAYDANKAFVPPQRVDFDILDNDIIMIGDLNNPGDIEQTTRMIGTYSRVEAAAGGGEPAGNEHLGLRKVPVEIALIFAHVSGRNSYRLGLNNGFTSGTVTIPDSTLSLRDWKISFGDDIYNLSDVVSNDSVLARPHLSTLNGAEARFHSGGQTGFEVSVGDNASVEWKDHGIIVTVLPVVTTDGRIHMRISMEVLTPSEKNMGIVDFNTFQHTSEAIVTRNEGVVLSGMIRELRNRYRTGVPRLGQVPILGFFFGNRSRAVENEELIVIAVPHVPRGVISAPVRTSDDAEWLLNCSMSPSSERRIQGDRDIWNKKWGSAQADEPVIYPPKEPVLMGGEMRMPASPPRENRRARTNAKPPEVPFPNLQRKKPLFPSLEDAAAKEKDKPRR